MVPVLPIIAFPSPPLQKSKGWGFFVSSPSAAFSFSVGHLLTLRSNWPLLNIWGKMLPLRGVAETVWLSALNQETAPVGVQIHLRLDAQAAHQRTLLLPKDCPGTLRGCFGPGLRQNKHF